MSQAGFTVLGADGFIGRHLIAHLRATGRTVRAVDRVGLAPILAGEGGPLGHVINGIGLTADFRTRLAETMETHVGLTARLLRTADFDSFLQLSSTRVYQRAAETHEDAALPVISADPSDLYNISKLAGESLCLADPRAAVRVVRLSNVYGTDAAPSTFLASVLRDAVTTGAVSLGQSAASGKDYIAVEEVAALLAAVAERGRHRLYNLASGISVSHGALAEAVRRLTGCAVTERPGAPTVTFPPIRIDRLAAEFGAPRSRLIDDLPRLVGALSKEQSQSC